LSDGVLTSQKERQIIYLPNLMKKFIFNSKKAVFAQVKIGLKKFLLQYFLLFF